MADSAPETVSEFQARINKLYGGNVIQSGGASGMATKMPRFSSGILSLDCALGGGWPYSRIVVVAGEYSTGKTLATLKAAESIMQYDHDTHLHRLHLPAGAKFTPGRVLFVDVEHAFDEAWAVAHGWDTDWHHVAKTEYAEQAIDIVSDAIRANLYDLIVIDSLQALTPTKEIEASSEDWQMGLGARLVNKAMRRWNASLSRVAQETPQGGPCIMALNGFRLKIGLTFGDPRTLPMGKGQEFAASIIVYTKGAQVKDDADTEHGFGEYGGVVYKNKTFTPKYNFKYRMALKDHPDWGKGEIDNVKQIMALSKKYGIVYKDGKDWKVGADTFRVLGDIEAKVRAEPDFEALLWRSIIQTFGGDSCT